MMKTTLRASMLALAVAAMVACGGGGGSSSSGAPAGSTTFHQVDFQFKPKTMSVAHGKVVFFLVNDGPSAHDMVIADSSGQSVARSSLVQPGDTSTFTIDNLAAGTYTVFCDVPGHRAAGMEGTLTVT